ncbi:hypothetical protein [Streptomyces sp. NPDC003077]|uniref:hypothetical protein n=1 Tax=Streptomyces sp. NPDC003077 TaxID=3154443 RepID=UPI0033A41C10
MSALRARIVRCSAATGLAATLAIGTGYGPTAWWQASGSAAAPGRHVPRTGWATGRSAPLPSDASNASGAAPAGLAGTTGGHLVRANAVDFTWPHAAQFPAVPDAGRFGRV